MKLRSRRRLLSRLEKLESRTLFSLPPIELGVQPAVLDQPRINALLRRTPTGTPITADIFGFQTFNIDAFYDTGASGILISDQTAGLFELEKSTFNGQDVIYSDIGVGGTEDFFVSETIYPSVAPYHPEYDIDNPSSVDSVYTQSFPIGRTQIGHPATNPLAEGLDVFGMPTMAGKVLTFDPKPVDTFLDTMRTYVYNPGTPFNQTQQDYAPGIPQTSHHVKMSYGDFGRFSQVTPAGAPGPSVTHNPFIGPDPTRAPGTIDNTPPVSFSFSAQSSSGSFLFDTGAAASILSQNRAAQVGVRYVPGTYGTDEAELETTSGGSISDQFTLTIGGVGGNITLAGLFLSSLTLQTIEGQEIEFVDAPVLVGDISVQNPNVPSDHFTLDGIFGMNYLVASCNIILAEPFPIIFDLTEGGFNWMTFDEPNGILGLDVKGAPSVPRVTDQLYEYDVSPNAFYMQFSKDVSASLTTADLVVQNLTTSQTIPTNQLSLVYDNPTNTATLNFPGYANNGVLPDGNYRVRVIASGVTDSSGNPMAADYVNDFFQLGGDANRDRTVGLGDFSVFTAHFQQQSDQTWGDGDFTYDGAVTLGDFSILTANFMRTLPVPPPPSSVPASASSSTKVPISAAQRQFAAEQVMRTLSTSRLPGSFVIPSIDSSIDSSRDVSIVAPIARSASPFVALTRIVDDVLG